MLRRARWAVIAGLVWAMPALSVHAADADLSAYRQGLALSLQKSSSPRDWALGAELLDTQADKARGARQRDQILQKAALAAPDDRLVQVLWANSAALCPSGQRCPDHSAALQHLDPDNSALRLAAIDQAWKRGDVRGTDAAIRQMAGADRYNEHFSEAIAAWRDVFSRYPPPNLQSQSRFGADASSPAGNEIDLAFDEAVATAEPPTASLVEACARTKQLKAIASRFAACAKIARVMMGHSQTMSGRMAGVAVLRVSHAGDKADINTVRAVTWEYEQYLRIEPSVLGNAVAKQNHVSLVQTAGSEMQIIQYELSTEGIVLTPPDGWKETIDGKPVEPLDDVPTPTFR
jgi:hypothetical protein